MLPVSSVGLCVCKQPNTHSYSLTIWFTIVAMMIFSCGRRRRHTISIHWIWCSIGVIVVVADAAAAATAATAVAQRIVIASICGPNQNYGQQQIITNLWISICRKHIAALFREPSQSVSQRAWNVYLKCLAPSAPPQYSTTLSLFLPFSLSLSLCHSVTLSLPLTYYRSIESRCNSRAIFPLFACLLGTIPDVSMWQLHFIFHLPVRSAQTHMWRSLSRVAHSLRRYLYARSAEMRSDNKVFTVFNLY